MLSRIFWVGIAGIALVTGMVLQDGDWFFDMARESEISAKTDRAVDRTVDRVVDRAVDVGADSMQVVGTDGREIDVPPETKRAFGEAIGRLVKAEASLAILRAREGSSENIRMASARRDQARAEVDALKAAIKQQEEAAKLAGGDVSQQIEQDIRDEVRATVRDAVRN